MIKDVDRQKKDSIKQQQQQQQHALKTARGVSKLIEKLTKKEKKRSGILALQLNTQTSKDKIRRHRRSRLSEGRWVDSSVA